MDLSGDEELVAELGGLEGVPEDQEVDHDGHGDSDDDDGEAADEHVEEIELGDEEDQENGYEAARRKEPSGPDTSTKQFERHTDSVYCVALSPSSSVAVSGGGDDVAYLWNTESGSEIACLKGHTDSVVAVAFSHDGKLVATGSYDSTVKVWDASTGELIHSLEGPSGEVEWVTFHPKGAVVLAGSGDGTAWMWDVTRKSSAACMQVFAGHEDGVTCGGFDPAGKSVCTGSADGAVRVFSPKTAACSHIYRVDAAVNAIAFHPSPDKPLLAIGSQDGIATIINTATQKVIIKLQHQPQEDAAAELEKAKRKAAAKAAEREAAYMDDEDDDGMMGQDDDDEEGPEEGDIANRSVESVAFCGSHPFVASGATDGEVLLYDLNSATIRARLGHDEAVTRLGFFPGSPILVVSTADGRLSYYDARDGSKIAEGTGHRGMIIDVAFSSVGPVPASGLGKRRVVTAGDDGVCRVYEH